MTLIITLIIAVIVFCLVWYAIGYVPVPSGLPWLKNVLYVLLLLAAAYFLYTKFIG